MSSFQVSSLHVEVPSLPLTHNSGLRSSSYTSTLVGVESINFSTRQVRPRSTKWQANFGNSPDNGQWRTSSSAPQREAFDASTKYEVCVHTGVLDSN